MTGAKTTDAPKVTANDVASSFALMLSVPAFLPFRAYATIPVCGLLSLAGYTVEPVAAFVLLTFMASMRPHVPDPDGWSQAAKNWTTALRAPVHLLMWWVLLWFARWWFGVSA